MDLTKFFKVLTEFFNQVLKVFIGFMWGAEQEKRKQSEQQVDILKEQAEISNQPDEENPLQAMRDFAKKKKSD